MKIAFTTNDRVHINAHFGWAKRLMFMKFRQKGISL
ncbi:MAG: hypothetical protein CLLPBCKN_005515 [Chroococcidiopsis cubana SAG 39.79]|nr:hypothetical protein [Chroococcidiopsis cubana SAG 39.79]